jgi:hypothetical protein
MVVAYIFGYGSLAHPEDWAVQEAPAQPVYGFLRDYLRHFRLGIDNQSPAYDHKYYHHQGQRSNYIIGALGISPQPGAVTNGIAIPVDQQLFDRISTREKSYYLSPDLRELFSVTLDQPLFTYYPRDDNYQLYRRGLKTNNIVIPRSYLDYCQQGLAAYDQHADLLRQSARLEYPLANLDLYRAPGAI